MNEKATNQHSETPFEGNNKIEIFTNQEAAEFLRISSITLWRERKKGKISFRRVSSKIVYLREDLENYLNQNKREAFGVQN